MDNLKKYINRNIELIKVNQELHSEIDSLKKKILFDDYSQYSPKYRKTLETSAIRKRLDTFYSEKKASVEAVLREFCQFKDNFHKIPLHPLPGHPLEPSWHNGWLPALDAVSLYAYVALRNPRYFVECGSGNSTKFVKKAIIDNGLRTRIISIDPYPRAEIDILCDKQYRIPLEDMDLQFFRDLSAEDLFFIDNSHRSFQNSDVTVFFTEILPELPKNLLFGVHDIFLPKDYPQGWDNRYYNEQYLLCCYILGGDNAFTIELPVLYLSCYTEAVNILDKIWGEGSILSGVEKHGGIFWMTKA